MSRATIPYENQIIAAFIFALGFAASAKSKTSLNAVNLLQQTPMDPTFGDFVAGFELCVAIEFKRTQDDLPSELRKWHPEGVRAFLSRPDLLHAAQQAHLIAFFEPEEEAIFTCPYPTVFQDSATFTAIDAIQIIEEICGGEGRGLAPKLLQAYLTEVARLRRGPNPPPDGPVPASTTRPRRATEPWLAIAHDRAGNFSIRVAASLGELLGQTELTPDPVAATKRRGGPAALGA